MPDVATTERSLEERERPAERALGAIANEVKHLAAQVAEYAATIRELKDERRSIKQKFEAIERDLLARKVPKEVLSNFSSSIATLTQRLERLEATAIDKEETKPPKPPKRHDEDRQNRREADKGKRRQGQPEHRQSPTSLDSWF